MAARDSVEVEALGLKQFPNVCKRDIEWTSLQLFEKFLTLTHEGRLPRQFLSTKQIFLAYRKAISTKSNRGK